LKIVVVSQRVDVFPARNETRDALDQGLIEFLLVAGCLPIPVPNYLFDGNAGNDIFDEWIARIAPQGIVLSGGNDVGSCPSRDLTENSLLDYAEHNLLPVLGICRGMQIIGIRAGVELRSVVGHARTRHTLSGEIICDTNSYHNLALAATPTGFDVLARSSDGEIEAIRHQTLPWQGWMWHPERERPFAFDDIERLRKLLGSH
jgi:gamma-glutamyl-gamma-aminobutyrate hydrolase PuuD